MESIDAIAEEIQRNHLMPCVRDCMNFINKRVTKLLEDAKLENEKISISIALSVGQLIIQNIFINILMQIIEEQRHQFLKDSLKIIVEQICIEIACMKKKDKSDSKLH